MMIAHINHMYVVRLQNGIIHTLNCVIIGAFWIRARIGKSTRHVLPGMLRKSKKKINQIESNSSRSLTNSLRVLIFFGIIFALLTRNPLRSLRAERRYRTFFFSLGESRCSDDSVAWRMSEHRKILSRISHHTLDTFSLSLSLTGDFSQNINCEIFIHRVSFAFEIWSCVDAQRRAGGRAAAAVWWNYNSSVRKLSRV